MITAINYAPSYLQGTYNPIIWSVQSDETYQDNFSYIFDVYINSTFQIRLKVKPNPVGAGMIDISQICQAYLTDTLPETSINTLLNLLIFADNGQSSLHTFVICGEEFGGQIYDGNGHIGAPNYYLYANTNGGNQLDVPVHVWNSSLEHQQQQDGMSMGIGLSGGYGYLQSRNKSYDWGDAVYNYATLAYALNYAPLNQKAYYKDMNVLSFINWTQYYQNLDESYIAICQIDYYDAGGNLINLASVSVDSSYGFNQKNNCNDVITTQLGAEFDILHVQCKLESLMYFLNIFTSNSYVMLPGEYFEVQMFNHAVGNGCINGIPITQKSRFTMLEDCDTLYTRVRLSWLNDLGGRDYMNFTAFMEKETKTTNSNYYQETMDWAGYSPLLTNIWNPNYNLQTRGGDVIYNKQAMTSWTLNTDWLTQDEVNLLEGLQKSSNVIAYFNDTTYNQYAPQSVHIGQASYKTKNIKQVKMVQAEFEIMLNHVQKIN